MDDDVGALRYKVEVLTQQTAFLEQALNEARGKVGLPAIQMPKMARGVSDKR